MTRSDVIKLIGKDKWMMDILQGVEKLELNDWMIGAGFVRSKIWDHMHGYSKRTPLPDIDVIYFDKEDFSSDEFYSFSSKAENNYQNKLKQTFPHINWSVTNQARMHVYHQRKPYENSKQALSEWSETATCVAVTLENDKVKLIDPWGVEDLIKLELRKIPDYEIKYKHNPRLFYERIEKKQWLKKWPKLKIVS